MSTEPDTVSVTEYRKLRESFDDALLKFAKDLEAVGTELAEARQACAAEKQRTEELTGHLKDMRSIIRNSVPIYIANEIAEELDAVDEFLKGRNPLLTALRAELASGNAQLTACRSRESDAQMSVLVPIDEHDRMQAELTAAQSQVTALRVALEEHERAMLDVREKAAVIANNGAEEKDRFLGRQIILLSSKAIERHNQQAAASPAPDKSGQTAAQSSQGAANELGTCIRSEWIGDKGKSLRRDGWRLRKNGPRWDARHALIERAAIDAARTTPEATQ